MIVVRSCESERDHIVKVIVLHTRRHTANQQHKVSIDVTSIAAEGQTGKEAVPRGAEVR